MNGKHIAHDVEIHKQRTDRSIPITVDGKFYPSHFAAYKDLGINDTAVRKLMQEDISKEEAISIAIENAKKRSKEKEARLEKRKARAGTKRVHKMGRTSKGDSIANNAVNPPPKPDTKRIESDKETYKTTQTPAEPAWHKRNIDKKHPYAIKHPFCPVCDYPLFIYDKVIGDYVWGYRPGKYINNFCPHCGQAINWKG